ncbi:MAG: 4-hydroxybenzoate octaprenyltransferase [Candidatus Aquicultor secundus]|uniref:4-hydroxybenzoate polyprenyltransferase n=1 Tax=Candidatus Aquicultor secundus TaxID=1973895 RepID=A0A2M7T631_9ACTN|nr:UbiA-like polyprenyltransferase [Candidatus Aquicultor secundus]NCO65755.1 UbiA family prenyltransferase [Solirubrobacter sp.]PIU26491.1 MAG: 4-hydroxybenzoate octaprenyltransferase [Candidatus Aquicultor secundus]PIW21538.1 MAG: 4-hydroxybenzoate octaprenyltransferase [Candidatus Aquicultor secundus]PIX52635.1 MAG: 4-hydroxybenzoate octaprenyltransferase [Candidatus Aquicultor secundus]PIY39290.1 MAG: 4-hydroxybenzoate octaprenyltransferase [Candidatus Aquicultor secundus]
MGKFKTILEMIKFEHTIFALPFAYMGMMLAANGLPSLKQIVWITIAMVGARSFSMAMNRYIDREIDARNPRTKERAIPAGKLTSRYVMVFSMVSLAVFFIATYQLAPLARVVWPAVVFPLIIYSYTKRFTWLNHVVLGISLGLAPIGAWIAITNGLSWPVVILGGAVMLWSAGFDIIYACQDIDVDHQDGLLSIPAVFGVKRALLVTRMFHVLTVGLLFTVGVTFKMGAIYYFGVMITALLLAYENRLVKPNDLSRVNMAFFTVNGFISLQIFAFTGLDFAARYLLKGLG